MQGSAEGRRCWIFPLLLGLGGCAILIALGLWQLQRLEWKRGILDRIESRIAAPAISLPPPGSGPEAFKYRAVTVSGTTGPEELHVLGGHAGMGPGYEIITSLTTTSGRRILLDRGFVAEAAKDQPRPPVPLEIRGNLHWPEETTGSTPAPDMTRNIWFARDVSAMAQRLGTEALMVVARDVTGQAQGITPVPVSADGIRNAHLQYALTWFSLAGVWAGMTVLLWWRIRHRTI